MIGIRHEKATELVSRTAQEGGNFQVAHELLARMTKPTDFMRMPDPIKWALTGQAMMKLNPLTTVVNFSQNLPTAMMTSPGSVFRAIKNYDTEFARKSGAIIGNTINDVLAAHGATSSLGNVYMRSIGFKKSEEILRTIAANAGKQYAFDLFEMLGKGGRKAALAERKFRAFGVDPAKVLRQGRLLEEDLLMIGKRVSDMTQFRGDKFDLPIKWIGPYGRLVTQFKTFIFNQARFLKDHVIKEAAKGNPKPLLFLLTAYPIAGAGHSLLVNNVLLGKEPPESLPGWYFEGLTTLGGLGMFETALTAGKFGREGALSFLAGPTLADAAILASAAWGNENVVREVAGRIPYVGRYLRAQMKNSAGKEGRRRRSRPARRRD
jgi:hypothetical protein